MYVCMYICIYIIGMCIYHYICKYVYMFLNPFSLQQAEGPAATNPYSIQGEMQTYCFWELTHLGWGCRLIYLNRRMTMFLEK